MTFQRDVKSCRYSSGCSSVVEHVLPKHNTRVRFPPPALKPRKVLPRLSPFCYAILLKNLYVSCKVAVMVTGTLYSKIRSEITEYV